MNTEILRQYQNRLHSQAVEGVRSNLAEARYDSKRREGILQHNFCEVLLEDSYSYIQNTRAQGRMQKIKSEEVHRNEAPKTSYRMAIGDRCPPPQPTRGSGDVVSSSSRGSEAQPRPQTPFSTF